MRDDPTPQAILRDLDGLVVLAPCQASELRRHLNRLMATGTWSDELRDFKRAVNLMGRAFENRGVGKPVVKEKSGCVAVVEPTAWRRVESMGITEAAAVVGISRQGMQKRVDTGKVPGAFKDGRRFRIPTAQVKAMQRAERFTTVVDTLRKGEARYLEALALLDGLRVDEPAIADALAIDLTNKLAIVRVAMSEATRAAAEEIVRTP